MIKWVYYRLFIKLGFSFFKPLQIGFVHRCPKCGEPMAVGWANINVNLEAASLKYLSTNFVQKIGGAVLSNRICGYDSSTTTDDYLQSCLLFKAGH